MTPKLSPKLTPKEAKITFSPQEGNPPHGNSSSRRTKQPSPTKATRLGAAQNLPTEILTEKRKPKPDPSSNAAKSDASAKASANAVGISSNAVHETRDAAAFAAMAARKRAFFPEQVTLSKLLSELDMKRKKLGRKSLKEGQKLRLRQSWEHHRSSPVTTSNRYQPLLDRIQATKAKNSGQVKLSDVLTRMEKANDEPYTSGKRPQKRVNNNGKVNDVFGNRILCGAYAGARAEDVLVSKDGKSDARLYATHSRIYARLGDGSGSRRFEHLIATAPIKEVIDCQDFGEFAKQQFSEMTRGSKGRNRIRAGVIVIGAHAAPAWLKAKNSGARPRFVINVGDFTRGNGDRRLQKPGPSRFSGYSLESFLTPAACYAYYTRNGSETCGIYLHDADVPSWEQIGRPPAARYRINTGLSSQTLQHLFHGDFPFEADWVHDQLDGKSAQEVFAILKASNPIGFTGMFLALQFGNSNAIRSFDEALRAILGDPQHRDLHSQVAGLLSSRCVGGNGLFKALARGNDDAIEAYGKLLLDLHAAQLLTDDELTALLQSDDQNGMTGISAAVWSGYGGAVDAFLDVIARVPEPRRASLVSLRCAGGGCAIADALKRDDFEMVDRLLDVLVKAQSMGIIDMDQFVALSMSQEFQDVVGPDGEPPQAYQEHTRKVLALMMATGDSDSSTSN